MGITLNSGRIVADAKLAGIHGGRVAGAHALRLSVEFSVLSWDANDPPQVILAPARVQMTGQSGIALGVAFAETIQPFTVTKHSTTRAVIFELLLSPQAMEIVEQFRDGRGVSLVLNLHGEIRRAGEVQAFHEAARGDFNVAHWVAAMEQAGYGRSLLLEVPVPSELPALGPILQTLETARRLLLLGHYADVVAKCRLVIEGVTAELNQGAALKAALTVQPKANRSVEQRELVMRQAAMDFASLAHHPTDVAVDEIFGRNAAQMMLGITAALVSSAMARSVHCER